MNMSISQRFFTTQFETANSYFETRLTQAGITDEERTLMLRSQVTEWMEKQLKLGNEPDMDGFTHFYPEYMGAQWTDIIEAEINRVSELCRREAK